MSKYYNSQVKTRRFAVGDLVLKKVTLVTQDPTEGKLKPNWGALSGNTIIGPGPTILKQCGGSPYRDYGM